MERQTRLKPAAPRRKLLSVAQRVSIKQIVRAIKGGNPAHIQRAHRNSWPLWAKD